jgi:hypothetical protein
VGGKRITTSDELWKQFLRAADLGDGGATDAAEASMCNVDINLLLESRLRRTTTKEKHLLHQVS